MSAKEHKLSRSEMMGRVHSRDTHPEMVVRRLLHAKGLRFRLHRSDLPGKPDIVLPKHRTVILVHGCFWHGCPNCKKGCTLPKTNVSFWRRKIQGNIERDKLVQAELERVGWNVVTVWECQTKDTDTLSLWLVASLRNSNENEAHVC